MKHIGIAVLFVALFFPVSAFSVGDPTRGFQPIQGTGLFSVFGAGTLREGGYAIEPAVEIVREPDIQRLALRAGYGVTENVDVAVNFSVASTDMGDGVEDVSIGGRYRFLDEGRFGPSAAAVFSVSVPIGEASKGLGSDELETMGLLVASKRVGPFTGYLNAGYNLIFSENIADQVILSGGLDFSAASRLALMAEIYGRTSRTPDKNDLIEARLGYRIALDEWITNSVGLGFGLDSGEPEYRIIVMFTFRLPRDEPEIIRVRED